MAVEALKKVLAYKHVKEEDKEPFIKKMGHFERENC